LREDHLKIPSLLDELILLMVGEIREGREDVFSKKRILNNE